MEFQLSYFKSWNFDDAVKVLHSMCQQIWTTQQWPQDWKRSVFIPITKEDNAEECSNYSTVVLISQASKVMLKILQASFQQVWTKDFQIYRLDLEKAEEPEIKLPKFLGSYQKQGNSRKTATSLSSTMLKPLTVWITTNCETFLNRWEYQTTLTVSWATWMWVKKQKLQPNMEQWTVQHWERGTSLLYIVTLLI